MRERGRENGKEKEKERGRGKERKETHPSVKRRRIKTGEFEDANQLLVYYCYYLGIMWRILALNLTQKNAIMQLLYITVIITIQRSSQDLTVLLQSIM